MSVNLINIYNCEPVYINPERNKMTLVQRSTEAVETLYASRNKDDLDPAISNELFSKIPDDVFENLKNILPQVQKQQQQIPMAENCSILSVKQIWDEINLLEIEEGNLIKERNEYIAQLEVINEKLKSIYEELDSIKNRRSQAIKKLKNQIYINSTQENQRTFSELTCSLQQNMTSESCSENEFCVKLGSQITTKKKQRCPSSSELQKKIKKVSFHENVNKVTLEDVTSKEERTKDETRRRLQTHLEISNSPKKQILSLEKKTFGIRISRPARLGSRKKTTENSLLEKNAKTKESVILHKTEENIKQYDKDLSKQEQLLKKAEEGHSFMNSLVDNKLKMDNIEINKNNPSSNICKIINKDNNNMELDEEISNFNNDNDNISKYVNKPNNQLNISTSDSSIDSILIKKEKSQEFATSQNNQNISRVYLECVDFPVPKVKAEKE